MSQSAPKRLDVQQIGQFYSDLNLQFVLSRRFWCHVGHPDSAVVSQLAHWTAQATAVLPKVPWELLPSLFRTSLTTRSTDRPYLFRR